MYKTKLSEEHLNLLHDEALKTLKLYGLAIENDSVIKMLQNKGHKAIGNRVYFEPCFINEQLKSIIGSSGTTEPRDEFSDNMITIGTGDMPQYYLNAYTGKTDLMTVESLIQATKFQEASKSSTVWSMVPGVPRDVPYQLQALTEYYIGCEYCSNGGNIDTFYPEAAIPFLYEMAEAMGKKIGGGIFTISPLKIGGFELDAVLKYMSHIDHFSVSSLPTPGAGSPLYQDVSWVVSIAEAIGAASVLHLLSGGKPVSINVGMFPFDLHSLAVVGGAPEYVLMEYEKSIISKRYNTSSKYYHTLSTMDKTPGLQAGMEKAYGAGFAVALGCRSFGGAGLLCFDDIFSPEQMVADIEFRNMVQRLVTQPGTPPVDKWQEIIGEGLQSGYVCTKSTLDSYKDNCYFPELFERNTIKSGMAKHESQSLRDKLRRISIERIESHGFVPEEKKIENVRNIFQNAWNCLCPGMKPPVVRAL